LRKDKVFLNEKNNAFLNETRQYKDDILNRDNKILDLKNTKRKLKNELSQMGDLSKTKHMDEMLHTELEKIRTKSDEELKSQKKMLADMHSNELKILRDQFEQLKELNDKLEHKLRSRENQYDDLMSD